MQNHRASDVALDCHHYPADLYRAIEHVEPASSFGNLVTASVANLEQEAAGYERVLGFHRSALLGGRKDFGLYQMTMPGNRIDLVWQVGSARHQQAKGRME